MEATGTSKVHAQPTVTSTSTGPATVVTTVLGIACQDGVIVDEVWLDGLHLVEIAFCD